MSASSPDRAGSSQDAKEVFLRDLSWPVGGMDAERAARSVLDGSDVATAIDALYPELLRHHVLPSVLANLESAGGDLADLSVSSALVASLWPYNRLLPPFDPTTRIPLASLRARLQEHRDLLDDLVASLRRRSVGDRFLLLFGGAIRAQHPGYSLRLHNDVDVFAPDGVVGMELLDELWGRGFMLARYRRGWSAGGPVFHAKLIRKTDGGHEVHVDVIAGGRPAGPGMRPAWIHPELFPRSVWMPFANGDVRTPSAEDILLMLSEKTHRRGAFTLRDRHDARILLSDAGRELDWDYLSSTAARHRLSGSMWHLGVEAERWEGRPLVPAGVLRGLRPGRRESRLIESGQSVRWRRMWYRQMTGKELIHPLLLARVMGGQLGSALLKTELKFSRSGLRKSLARAGGRSRTGGDPGL